MHDVLQTFLAQQQIPLPGSLFEQQVNEARRDGAAKNALPFYVEPDQVGNIQRTGILLLHGYCAGPAQCFPLAQELYAQGFAVYIPRLRGHGTTPEDLRRCKWSEWHRDVELAYQFLRSRCERIFVLGLSLGGTLGYLLASEYPEIKGVVTNGAIFKVAHWGAKPLRIVEAVLEHVFRTDLGVIHHSFGMPKVTVPEHEQHFSYDTYPLRANYQIMELADYVHEHLSKVQCPVLVIQSEKDNVVHRDSAEIITSSIASTKKDVLWYGDEHVILDQPGEDIIKRILDFIRG